MAVLQEAQQRQDEFYQRQQDLNDWLDQLAENQRWYDDYMARLQEAQQRQDEIYQRLQDMNDYLNSLQQTQDYLNQITQG